MRLDFIACKYTHFIQYGKTMEYFFVKKKGILVEHVFLYIFPCICKDNSTTYSISSLITKNKKKAVYIMNVTLIQEKPDLELCKPGFLIIIKTTKDKSICHFRNKLNTNQPDFILGIVITQLIHRVIYFICCRFLEVIINIVQMVFIHNFL